MTGDSPGESVDQGGPPAGWSPWRWARLSEDLAPVAAEVLAWVRARYGSGTDPESGST